MHVTSGQAPSCTSPFSHFQARGSQWPRRCLFPNKSMCTKVGTASAFDSFAGAWAGSGVLAIAALLLGAASAAATDVDPLAVRAAGANAALNGVAERIIAVPCVHDMPLPSVTKIDVRIASGRLAVSLDNCAGVLSPGPDVRCLCLGISKDSQIDCTSRLCWKCLSRLLACPFQVRGGPQCM